MILLLNLNTYIGGGETLLIRIAQYLHLNGHSYQIMTAGGNCWISQEAARQGLNCVVWPSEIDSIVYQSTSQRSGTVESMNAMYSGYMELRVFTFCLRDFYNALYVFTRIPEIMVLFSHGIYHPEDVFYLSSLSVSPGRIIAHNRTLTTELFEKKSILFVNQNGLKISLCPDVPINQEIIKSAIFIPLPININGDINTRKLDASRPLRIICISRFVSFKVGAVLGIMRYAANRPSVELLIIGHGSWKIILTTWIRLKGAKNIQITTGVAPEQLDSYIDTCDIGYAQGTSILEIAKRGLPVLIAPYSRIRDLFNPSFPILGIFGDVRDFSTFGDITDLRGQQTYAIADCIESIRLDYSRYQEQTIDFVKTFSSNIVCKRIFEFIMNAQFSNKRSAYEPPKPPIIKRIIKLIPGLHA